MNMGSNPNRKQEGQYPGESVAVKLRKGRLNSGGGHFAGKNLTTMNCDWDSAIPTAEYFTELMRVSKSQIIWGGNYFGLPATRCIICWDKMQPWENFSQWEMAWTSLDKPAPLIRLSNRGGANDENKIHPTQKPVKLYKWLLSKFGNGGGANTRHSSWKRKQPHCGTRHGLRFHRMRTRQTILRRSGETLSESH